MFLFWRESLTHFLVWFECKRAATPHFYAKLFFFFVAMNLSCYWLALLTTYPHLLMSYKAEEYVLMGIPVGVMGALFDYFSLFITLMMVRRALKTSNNARYMAYLSIDLLIDVLATLWVLFAFIASGWIVGLILNRPETFDSRSILFEGRVWGALFNPFGAGNLRNIYFGMIMGASALLPTLLHSCLAGWSAIRTVMQRLIAALC